MALNPDCPRLPARLPPAVQPAGRAGFTLVEVLLAIAVSTLVLLGASVFVFSAFNLLTQVQNDPGLEHHKLGVVGFLQYVFSQEPKLAAASTNSPFNSVGFTSPAGGVGSGGNTAGTSSGGNSSSGSSTPSSGGTSPFSTNPGGNSNSFMGNSTVGNNQVSWQTPSWNSASDNPMLSFRIDDGVDNDPLFVWTMGPRPPATGYLYFHEGEGLSILWQTDQQAQLTPDVYQRTLLSPLVTKVTYVYYDTENSDWVETDSPSSTSGTNPPVPNFIRLTFKINGKEEVATVSLPYTQTGPLMY
jgi:prepilin-type N-terminal cleavage/methylation domain-containing protein